MAPERRPPPHLGRKPLPRLGILEVRPTLDLGGKLPDFSAVEREEHLPADRRAAPHADIRCPGTCRLVGSLGRIWRATGHLCRARRQPLDLPVQPGNLGAEPLRFLDACLGALRQRPEFAQSRFEPAQVSLGRGDGRLGGGVPAEADDRAVPHPALLVAVGLDGLEVGLVLHGLGANEHGRSIVGTTSQEGRTTAKMV
jgi:hypothetical protein